LEGNHLEIELKTPMHTMVVLWIDYLLDG